MHIKQIILSGFRSFRSQNEIEEFSPKHNAIVGRNGSGKSNFFDAIQFVLLGPRFASLRQEDRQHLLHEGAGSNVMAAYVEIIFDNTDGRLSVDSDEVVLRRTVGLKKDEFFLNRKRVQKSEVQSMLESAGFSKSNPYYIVQQGKVSNLCVMKDKDRLNLLKEIAGTTVYEERRSESYKILQDTANKQERITEVLSFIEDRLSELETEKEELVEYEQLDKNRKALQFTLHENELTAASEQLSAIEVTREEERSLQQERFNALAEIEEQKIALEDDVNGARTAVNRLEAKHKEKVKEAAGATKTRIQLEADLEEAINNSTTRKEELAQLNTQLQEVMVQIDGCTKELEAAEPEYDAKTAQLNELRDEAERAQARMEALYGKQGRGRQFSSKKERDTFLQQQIAALGVQLRNKEDTLTKLSSDIEAEERRLEKEKGQVEKMHAEVDDKKSRQEGLGADIKEQMQERNHLQEQRKQTWKKLDEFQEQMQQAKQDLERGKQQLNCALPRHISAGLAAVEKIVKEKNVQGYYGPVVDNFTLRNDAFRTSVEVAAGNTLFNVIVDTDATAAELMKELERKKAGRITFLPLNRLHNPNITYPDSSDVRPLMEVALDYDQAVKEAIKHVFGKKLLARDLEVAARFSKECQLDAITRDGDLANRRGGFEGGYHDDRVSRLAAVARVREANERIAELSAQEFLLKEASEAAEAAVNESLRELQRLEAERNHLKTTIDQTMKEVFGREKKIGEGAKALESRKIGIATLNHEISTSQMQIDSFTDEMKTPLSGQLSDEEKQELQELLERSTVLKASLESMEAEHMTLVSRQKTLRAELESNFLRRKDEIHARLSALSVEFGISGSSTSQGSFSSSTTQADEMVATLRLECQFATRADEVVQVEIAELESALSTRRKELGQVEKELEVFAVSEKEARDEMNMAAQRQDKLLNKRSMLLHTVQDNQRKIRDLGVLPRKELSDLQGRSEKQLMKKLKEVNERLKKFASVNKKALEQYLSFNEQREMLLARQEEITSDNDSIKQLIETLDAQKEESILRTFENVSKHFSDVFTELVPGGKGTLVMKSSIDEPDIGRDDNTEYSEEMKRSSGASKKGSKGRRSSTSSASKRTLDIAESTVSAFTGVEVRVAFSGSGQQFEMQQLSGGQKALVALAIIFAIQRADPAPFYLFDELDQALDANYRAGVARLIQKQAESTDAPAQFITTTFRPELVNVAHKCYGIALQSKSSRIYPLEKADAQNFVTNLMTEEEAVGAVSSVPVYPRGTEVPSAGKLSRRGSRAATEEAEAERLEDDDDDEDEEDAIITGDLNDIGELRDDPSYAKGDDSVLLAPASGSKRKGKR
jgi:structural maintenance of chromosome 3 (chondroitin sulfate proteoglycan 6)